MSLPQVSALPNALVFDALEGLMAHSGFLQPFVGGAGQVGAGGVGAGRVAN